MPVKALSGLLSAGDTSCRVVQNHAAHEHLVSCFFQIPTGNERRVGMRDPDRDAAVLPRKHRPAGVEHRVGMDTYDPRRHSRERCDLPYDGPLVRMPSEGFVG